MQIKKTESCWNWSNYVAQHTWTNFQHNLGPILKLNTTFLHFCVSCLNHYFYSVSAQFLKRHQEEKKLFVSTPVLTALVKMLFFCWGGGFGNSSFWRDVFLIDSKNKLTKYQSKKTNKNTTIKQETKYTKIWLCVAKQKRQQTETTKEHLETNNKNTKKTTTEKWNNFEPALNKRNNNYKGNHYL